LIPARLRWDDDQPSSRQFGDIYHAPDGAAEVERVFIEPQRLTERLAQTRGVFTIGELGFGTALNFAVIAQRHLAHAPPSARLHFISVDKYPLTLPDFTALARRRARVLPIYSELARHYPPLIPGWHRRHLAHGRITLSVFFGDASNGLDDIARRQRLPVDAWLLDGFAPDRNPELWNAELWRALAALSADGTTIATFSAVGEVRRGLGDAGFTMRKIDQRPHKRHTLAGTFVSTHRPHHATPGRIIVVGGGLAGACTARQFAQRGVSVTLLDGSEAPPNRMAATLLHCRLLPGGGAPARARRLGYLYAQHWYEQHAEAIDEPLPSGVLHFPGASFDERRIEEAATAYAPTGRWVVPVDATTASALAGLPVRRSALYFPYGRALDLETWCDALVRHPLIDYRAGVTATAVSTGTGATVQTNVEMFEGDHVVLCAGSATNTFSQARYLELVAVWGQTERIAPQSTPSIPLVGDGFMVPLRSGWGIGATYEHKPWSGAAATDFNTRRYLQWWLGLTGAEAKHRHVSTLRGVRTVASDRTPIVGALFDAEGERIERLFISAGHGSQGTVSAPLAAECIAAEACGEFAPCTREEQALLSSMRFRQRQARRGPRHGAAV
jgi:tRNA 5-methylaminomethyl-2-thiouridine biosynthesis bifunctional protein